MLQLEATASREERKEAVKRYEQKLRQERRMKAEKVKNGDNDTNSTPFPYVQGSWAASTELGSAYPQILPPSKVTDLSRHESNLRACTHQPTHIHTRMSTHDVCASTQEHATCSQGAHTVPLDMYTCFISICTRPGVYCMHAFISALLDYCIRATNTTQPQQAALFSDSALTAEIGMSSVAESRNKT